MILMFVLSSRLVLLGGRVSMLILLLLIWRMVVSTWSLMLLMLGVLSRSRKVLVLMLLLVVARVVRLVSCVVSLVVMRRMVKPEKENFTKSVGKIDAGSACFEN